MIGLVVAIAVSILRTRTLPFLLFRLPQPHQNGLLSEHDEQG
jgi:branched-subunit amino acid transport protein AzlD